MAGLSFSLEAVNLVGYNWIRKLFFEPDDTPTFLEANGEFNEELNL